MRLRAQVRWTETWDRNAHGFKKAFFQPEKHKGPSNEDEELRKKLKPEC